jgi:hypothetical protein
LLKNYFSFGSGEPRRRVTELVGAAVVALEFLRRRHVLFENFSFLNLFPSRNDAHLLTKRVAMSCANTNEFEAIS